MAPGSALAATPKVSPQVDFPESPQTFGGGPAGTNNRAEIELFDSGDIAAGQSWTFVARKAGTFDYACRYHPMMSGRLVVQ